MQEKAPPPRVQFSSNHSNYLFGRIVIQPVDRTVFAIAAGQSPAKHHAECNCCTKDGRHANEGQNPEIFAHCRCLLFWRITDYWKHCSNLPTPGHHAPESSIVPETSALPAHTEHRHKLSLSMRSGFMEYRFDTVARCFNLDAEHIGRFSKRVPIG